jgi:xanthine dehydrogenase molybdopterin-binding subunit B
VKAKYPTVRLIFFRVLFAILVDVRAHCCVNALQYTWPQLIVAASGMQLDLNAEGIFSDFGDTMPFKYFVYAAACSTVEIDVLTGEVELLTSDIVYDAGQSLNPLLDVGQIEGAFVMGLGEFLTEQFVYDTAGNLLSMGTFEYKPPTTLDIPQTMNVRGILPPRAPGGTPW